MNKLMSWIFIGALLGVPASVLAADGVGAGIVKGTITIGGKPAKDAVVSIEGLSQDQIKTKMAHSKRQTKIIDQRNLKFIPTVVAIMAGETIDFPNNDKSWHNVYSKGGANDFDLGLYPPGKSRSSVQCASEHGSFHRRERSPVFFDHGQPGQLRDQRRTSG
jgi:plastocyanin